MKLQFKHQKFQAEAAEAVADVFAGQPCLASDGQNQPIVLELTDEAVLNQLNRIQRSRQIPPSAALEGRYNLTVEMETGVGKTYTYIKTMYELNRRYGWIKFIVVVPSIAVREGVYQSFQMTQEHFAEEYGRKIRFFIYDSKKLTEIAHFASGSSMNAMIINAQAFNAGDKDARRIYMRLDEFGSRRPIDILAGTNPILIIDEPQSAEGKQTRERLREFHPLFTLRYSATHRPDRIYNMVYRLDAAEAYRRRLVKKIAVKGISESGGAGGSGYVYLEGINVSGSKPAALLQFDFKGPSGVRKKTVPVGVGGNLYEKSGGMEEYREGYIVERIDGRDNHIEFLNGIRLYAGDMAGKVSEDQLRRIQIRETILSHIERERQLFHRGIKVLSLFFVDQVAKYRQYGEDGRPSNGIYAEMFEEEYADVIHAVQREIGDEEYIRYLEAIPAGKTHAGYFSVDKKGRMTDSRLSDRKKQTSDDAEAYDLIMKNKELLLDLSPEKSPVRFLFSHSALREGWDNPNVFQICTLKQSGSDVRRRQEVGRGLRLCVNQAGERMDGNMLGEGVHDVNVLTVIASESYDSFARGLQAELAENLGSASEAQAMRPENARGNNVELKICQENFRMPEFQKMWRAVSRKSVCTVDFDSGELIQKAIASLDAGLRVPGVSFFVESGELESIRSKEELLSGTAFRKKKTRGHDVRIASHSNVKYDLIGELAEGTGLTRKDVMEILRGIRPQVFSQFQNNPEEFIRKASALINGQKAAAVIRHIAYKPLDEWFGTEIFTSSLLKGRLGVNAMKTRKHLYDHLLYASRRERDFAAWLEEAEEVAVYVKLPDGFSVSTPAGPYTPGWAIAFREGKGTDFCFVAETENSEELMGPESAEAVKRYCAREHFQAVSGGKVIYKTADSSGLRLKSDEEKKAGL